MNNVRRPSRIALLSLAASTVAAVAAAPAAAQELYLPAVNASNYQPGTPTSGAPLNLGEGFLVGGYIIHPGVAVDVGYDSNVFYEGSGGEASTKLRTTASLTMANAPRTTTFASFAFNGQVSYRRYLQGGDAVIDQSGVSGGLGATLTLNPSGRFGITFVEKFSREREAPYIPRTGALNHNVDLAGAQLRILPAGPRLELGLGYTFQYDFYDSQELAKGDNITHALDALGRWKLLPRTYVSIAVSQGFIRWQNQTSAAVQKVDSNPFRASAGLRSLVTDRFEAGISAGYGAGLYGSGESPSTVVGGADVRYQVGSRVALSAGYTHDFSNSLFGNYYTRDTVAVRYSQALTERLGVWTQLVFERRGFSDVPMPEPGEVFLATSRADNFLDLSAAAEYSLSSFQRLGILYRINANLNSDFRLMNGTETQGVDYARHEIMGRVAVTY
jgi:hypothetical protein